MILILSENATLVPERDLGALVRMAVEAEDAGFDGVMVSEHLVLGESAGSEGRMENPREYAEPGNQDPATAWPSSVVMLSAIAAATTRIRLIAAAILAPLRHPILIAKELATLDLLCQGRLVVQPTVSWHEPEYEALGVPFNRRGALLDEHLGAWEVLWRDTPATFAGKYYSFEDTYFEPKALRPEGPRLWFGGESVHDRLLARLVRYGSGYHPLGRPKPGDMEKLAAGMTAAGRDISELEMIGGTRAVFPSPTSVADLGQALATIPPQQEDGFTSFCIKPSQFTDDASQMGEWCREVIARVEAL